MMNDPEESDPAVVAMNLANKVGPPIAEQGEPRAGTKGKADQHSTCRAQDRESVSQGLDRIRQAARHRTKEKFTALFHRHRQLNCVKAVLRCFQQFPSGSKLLKMRAPLRT